MSALRPCLEFCCSPNTVSKFVRFFPKAALFFFVLHVLIIIYSYMGVTKPAEQVDIPRMPEHRWRGVTIAAATRNSLHHRNETNKDLWDRLGSKKNKKSVFDSARKVNLS